MRYYTAYHRREFIILQCNALAITISRQACSGYTRNRLRLRMRNEFEVRFRVTYFIKCINNNSNNKSRWDYIVDIKVRVRMGRGFRNGFEDREVVRDSRKAMHRFRLCKADQSTASALYAYKYIRPDYNSFR